LTKILSRNLHILVVDDQESSRTLARFCLEDLGFTNIKEVESAKKGMEYVAENWKKGSPVQLILLDHQMPEVTGLDFFKTLHQTEATRKVPILIVSSQQDRDIVKEMGTTGVVHYVVKPLTLNILKEKLSAIFGGD
jgi:two-component system chemotaxis response regulator CheY